MNKNENIFLSYLSSPGYLASDVCALIRLGSHGQTKGLGIVWVVYLPSPLGYLGTSMAEQSNLFFSDGEGNPSSWCVQFELVCR